MRNQDNIAIINAPQSSLGFGVDHNDVLLDRSSTDLLRGVCRSQVRSVSMALETNTAWRGAGGEDAIKVAMRALPTRSAEEGVLTRDHLRLCMGNLGTFTAVVAALAHFYLDEDGELWLSQVRSHRNRMSRLALHAHSLGDMAKNKRDAALRSPYLGEADAIVQVYPPFDGQDVSSDLEHVKNALEHVSLYAREKSEGRIDVADDLGSLHERQLMFR